MDNRKYFSAIFKEYIDGICAHIVDIRSRDGGVVTDQYTFDEVVSTMMPVTKIGGYVSFIADVKFENITFLPVYDFGGVSL